eukprot:Rmarinus@m.2981
MIGLGHEGDDVIPSTAVPGTREQPSRGTARVVVSRGKFPWDIPGTRGSSRVGSGGPGGPGPPAASRRTKPGTDPTPMVSYDRFDSSGGVYSPRDELPRLGSVADPHRPGVGGQSYGEDFPFSSPRSGNLSVSPNPGPLSPYDEHTAYPIPQVSFPSSMPAQQPGGMGIPVLQGGYQQHGVATHSGPVHGQYAPSHIEPGAAGRGVPPAAQDGGLSGRRDIKRPHQVQTEFPGSMPDENQIESRTYSELWSPTSPTVADLTPTPLPAAVVAGGGGEYTYTTPRGSTLASPSSQPLTLGPGGTMTPSHHHHPHHTTHHTAHHSAQYTSATPTKRHAQPNKPPVSPMKQITRLPSSDGGSIDGGDKIHLWFNSSKQTGEGDKAGSLDTREGGYGAPVPDSPSGSGGRIEPPQPALVGSPAVGTGSRSSRSLAGRRAHTLGRVATQTHSNEDDVSPSLSTPPRPVNGAMWHDEAVADVQSRLHHLKMKNNLYRGSGSESEGSAVGGGGGGGGSGTGTVAGRERDGERRPAGAGRVFDGAAHHVTAGVEHDDDGYGGTHGAGAAGRGRREGDREREREVQQRGHPRDRERDRDKERDRGRRDDTGGWDRERERERDAGAHVSVIPIKPDFSVANSRRQSCEETTGFGVTQVRRPSFQGHIRKPSLADRREEDSSTHCSPILETEGVIGVGMGMGMTSSSVERSSHAQPQPHLQPQPHRRGSLRLSVSCNGSDTSSPDALSTPKSLTSTTTPKLRQKGALSSPGVTKSPPKGSPSVLGRGYHLESSVSGPVEIADDELESSVNPHRDLKEAETNLKSSSWQDQYEALTMLRRLVIFHPDIFPKNLTPFLRPTLELLNSLRSGVSKNAVLLSRAMFVYLGKMMDTELETVVGLLLKKTSEANGFITAEVDKALEAMVENVSEHRAIQALLLSVSHKSPAVRCKVACHLERCIVINGPKVVGSREIRRLVPALAQLMEDANSETRKAARRAVMALAELFEDPTDFEHLVKKNLPPEKVQAFRETAQEAHRGARITDDASRRMRSRAGSTSSKVYGAAGTLGGARVSAEKERGESGPPAVKRRFRTTSAQPRIRVPGEKEDESSYSPGIGSADKRAPRMVSSASKRDKEPAEFEDLPQLYLQLSATDWKKREQGICKLTSLVCAYPSHFQARIVSTFDHFGQRLTDANTKVNILALQSLLTMIPLLKDALEVVVNVIVPKLKGNMLSANAQVRTLTGDVLDSLIDHIDNAALVQEFSSLALFGTYQHKTIILEKLAMIVHNLNGRKDTLLNKHVVPLSLKLLGETSRKDVTVPNAVLLRELYESLGSSLINQAASMSEAHRNKLLDILHDKR